VTTPDIHKKTRTPTNTGIPAPINSDYRRNFGLASGSMGDQREIERAIVGLVLTRERELDGLERLLGPDAVPAVKALAGAGVVLRHGERVWASPAVYRLDELRLVAA
jgi:hypothetical protein